MTEINVLKVPFRKLKWIAHLSDIHIRNLKRHREYEECFEKVYGELRKLPSNTVIYVGGDIVHAKTQMSPELIHQTSMFFENLADIAPTIIITGNHDCNLNNRSRMDALSPIVKNLNHPNLHYLKETGVYKIADTCFSVMSVFDNKKNYIKASDIESVNKISLFHGTVERSQTDFGFKLKSDIKINMFKGYDLALLGDIHKHQYLNRKKTVAYAGSLIAQNHGEDLNKGFLIWDVLKKKSEFIRVYNDYGYYTLDIDNGKVPEVDDMPPKARLRARISNTDAAQLKKVLAVIRHKYGIKDVTVNRVDGFGVDKIRGDKRINVGDITSSDYQYKLIEDYLQRNHIVSDDILVRIKNINDNLNSQLPEEDITRNVDWKIKSFEFENMFCYGKGNKIDFTKLDGIVGLFAPNAAGKSALLDALSFCLYDTCSRAFKANNVLNNKQKNFKCKVSLEINGLNYFIERKAAKQKNGHVKVNVNFWMVDDAGEEISLNGDQRRSTNANIRKVIGTYEDFVLTVLSLQNNNTVFIDKKQKERKELLAQFMGMSIFDELYTLAHEEVGEVSAILKDFGKQNYDQELHEVELDFRQYKDVQKELKKDKRGLTKDKRNLNEEIITSSKRLKPIDESIVDIDKLLDDKIFLNEDLNSIDTRLGSIKGLVQENKIRSKELEERVEKYTDENVNSKYLKLKQYEKERHQTKIEIDKLKIEVRHKLDKIEKLGNLEYDPDCDYCMSNPFTLDAIKTNKEIESDKEIAKQYVDKIDNLDKIIVNTAFVRKDKIDFDRALSALQSIGIQQNKSESEETLLKERKKNIIIQISNIEQKITEHHAKEKDISFNKQIEEEIDRLKNEVDNLEYQIEVVDDKLETAHGQIKVAETKKKTIIDTINKIQDLEEKFEAYKYYLDAIKRDGVPYELITKALPTIEGEVNDILAQIVDFAIILEMDGKNINTYLAYDEDNMWPLEMSSGMERFISSLAMRVGLINVSNLPCSNFLAIDEGFGNMDADNLNSVYMLFQYLKTRFQFTLIVSHIEQMRDTVDTLLEIKKEFNYSNIKFL